MHFKAPHPLKNQFSPNQVKLGEYVDATMESLSPKSSRLREMWTKQGLKMGHFQSKSYVLVRLTS